MSGCSSARWQPRLIAITDAQRFGVERTLTQATELCAGARAQSVVVQLREAEMPFELALSLGRALLSICRATEQALCINGQLDLAIALGTPRFHLKATSGSADAARAELHRCVGDAWLTRGWHAAEEQLPTGVDAVLVSPALAARKGRRALGIEGLRSAVAQAAPLPVFALGGVGAPDVVRLQEMPLTGVAIQAAWYNETALLLAALGITRVHG
jgi:thiamine monophosphate synthase